METLLLEDLSSWDPIEDLQLTEDLFPSVLNNWDNELGLGSDYQAKDPIEKKVGSSEIDLTSDELLEFDISNDLDEWMEEKIDLNLISNNLLENGDPVLEKVWSGINKALTEEVIETIFPTKLESVEAPLSEDQNETPPDSPDRIQDIAYIDEIGSEVIINTNSVLSGSSIESVVSETPPDTPPGYINIELEDTKSDFSSAELKPNLKPTSRKRKHSSKPDALYRGDLSVKKLRKRDQNRDAATRYRLKKRAEIETLCQQQSALEEKNNELKDRVDSLSSEIKYLKGLLKEIFLAKLQ